MPLTPTTVSDRLLRGSDVTLGFSLQTAYGAVNATPVFQTARRTSGKTKKTVSYSTDETVTGDFQGLEQIEESTELMGTLESSTSLQSVDLLNYAIFAAETIHTNTAATFAALVDGLTVSATSYAALEVGDGFWMSGFANPLLNVFYVVASKAAANKIVTTIAPVATETAGATVTLKFNRYKNADNAYYLTLQTKTKDAVAAGGVDHHTIYDSLAGSASFEIPATGRSTTTLEYSAEREVSGTAQVSGQTYAAVPTDKYVSSSKNIKAFYIDGLSATCAMKSLSISINPNLSADDAAGCSKRYSRGVFEVTGSFEIRVKISASTTFRDYHNNGTRISIGVLFDHSDGNETYIVIPQAVVTEYDAPDANGVSIGSVSFAAEGHSASASTIRTYTKR